jgi:hypothetical protein
MKNITIAVPEKVSKRKYTKPQIKKHGSVAKLTLKGGSQADFSNGYQL